EASLAYLEDAFGLNGTWASPGQQPPDPFSWANAVERGQELPVAPAHQHVLAAGPYRNLLSTCGATEYEPVPDADPHKHEAAWRAAASDLLQGQTPVVLADLVRASVEEAGARLARACFDEGQGRSRATSVSRAAATLFGGAGAQPQEALRGLLLIRGAGDSFGRYFPKLTPPRVASFRVHTFFRSLEGVFASAAGGGDGRVPGRLG